MPPPATSTIPVADLHCDLLAYLSNGDGRTADDSAARASLPQLAAGGVRTQVLAVFVPTDREALAWGARQVEAYRRLLRGEADRVRPIRGAADVTADDRIGVVPAFENASSFAGENEPLDESIARFETMTRALGPVLYVGLTWADDNRFGGGNRSRRGLTDDGRRLLDHLATRRHERGSGPAVDLAHASPWLADDTLEHLERRGADLPLLVSHTCFRHFVDTPRNLGDDLASAVAERGGVIGLNLMQWWNGGTAPARFVDQLRHARHLGLAESFCLGADFFCTADVPAHLRSKDAGDEFFPEFADAECYPRLIEALAEGADTDSDASLRRIAHATAEAFIASTIGDLSEVSIENPS